MYMYMQLLPILHVYTEKNNLGSLKKFFSALFYKQIKDINERTSLPTCMSQPKNIDADINSTLSKKLQESGTLLFGFFILISIFDLQQKREHWASQQESGEGSSLDVCLCYQGQKYTFFKSLQSKWLCKKKTPLLKGNELTQFHVWI